MSTSIRVWYLFWFLSALFPPGMAWSVFNIGPSNTEIKNVLQDCSKTDGQNPNNIAYAVIGGNVLIQIAMSVSAYLYFDRKARRKSDRGDPERN